MVERKVKDVQTGPGVKSGSKVGTRTDSKWRLSDRSWFDLRFQNARHASLSKAFYRRKDGSKGSLLHICFGAATAGEKASQDLLVKRSVSKWDMGSKHDLHKDP